MTRPSTPTTGLRLDAVELYRLELPLATPFRTATGTVSVRDVLLVKVVTESGVGWGECVAGSRPTYTEEYVDGARDLIVRLLAPRLLAAGAVAGHEVSALLADIVGHPMAKAALEHAVLDAQLRHDGQSLAAYLGATRRRVPVGVAVGIVEPIDALVETVVGLVAQGYARVKLKIRPGADLEPVRAVRAAVGDDYPLQVDANGSYADADVAGLSALDELGLTMIEQPLAADDLVGHARLASQLHTPVCLDESIRSVAALEQALALGACSIVNVKAGRVGGYLAARRMHDRCLDAGVPLWCGGMLETGIGRSANLALAALPGFSLPGDISESRRYWKRDVTAPFELRDALMDVPTGPGNGVDVDESYVDAVAVQRLTVGRDEIS